MSRLSKFIRSLGPLGDAARHERLLPLQRPGFPVAVCWSAKSGCTTVLKWFLAHNGLLAEALAHSGWVHDYRQDRLCNSRDYARQCDRLLKRGPGDVSVIKVIRDPASRAVSSFLHFLRCGREEAAWSGPAMVEQWKRAAGLGHQPGLSFRQFLMFVAAKQERRSPLDIHFRPQFDPEQDSLVDTFIPLEDLAAGLARVEARRGLPHVDVHQFSRSGHHNPPSAEHDWPGQAAAFAADHDTLRALGTPPSRVFLDPETRALIHGAYRVDYDAYAHAYGSSPASRQSPGTAGDAHDGAFERSAVRAA